MDELGILGFDDYDVNRILQARSLLGGATDSTTTDTYEDWDSLSNIKKNQVKTALHRALMTVPAKTYSTCWTFGHESTSHLLE